MKKTIALCLLFIISLFVITGCEGDSGLPSSKKSISLDFNKTIDYKDNYEVSFEKFESGKNIKKIYLESDDLNDKNNQYFVVWGKIKNIGTEKMDWWNMIPSTLIYDGKYKYEMTCKAVSQNDIQIIKFNLEKDLPKFVIKEFLNNGYKIDYKTASYFVDYVGKNVDILLSEINKMIIYKDTDKEIFREDILNISSKGFNDNVFDLSDAIMKKDFKKIFSCYNDLMILKEEPIKIIALLASQFTLVYQSKLLSKEGFMSKDIASTLKVHPYRVKLALEANYPDFELKDILKKLHNLDYEIKTGKVDKIVGLENFLLHL